MLRLRWYMKLYQLKQKSTAPKEDILRDPQVMETTLAVGLIAGLATAGLVAYGLWHIPSLAPFPVSQQDPRVPGTMSVNLSILWLLVHVIHKTTYRLYDWASVGPWLEQSGLAWHLNAIMGASIVMGVLTGAFAGFKAGRGRLATRHMSGYRLFDGPAQAYIDLSPDVKTSGPGIYIHPDVQISRDRETRSFLVTGSVGAGKTVTLWFMLQSIIKRMRTGPEDRIIIYDNKADFTGKLPVPDEQIALFAPWDKRTWAWDVGKDVLNEVDANELCQRLIPDSDDPFWSNAARQVLLACIIKLQRTMGKNWSWKDMNREIGSPEKIADNVLQYNPVLASLYEDPGNKTAQSVNTTLATFAATIRMLTQAWDNEDPYEGREYEPGREIPKLSLREWALTPVVEKRVLILQGNKRYEALEKGYVQAMLSAFRGIMASPEMTDSKSRRIWIVLDEFPQLGKLTGFSTYLEVGRSKGLCVVLGLQDLAQLREIYGRETAAVWESVCGTYIIGRSSAPETVEWVKKLVGERTIRRWMSSSGKGGGSKSEQETRQPVVDTTDVANLGPVDPPTANGKSPGVKNLLFTGRGKGIYRLMWPYPSSDVVKVYRDAQVPALWTTFTTSEDEATKVEDAYIQRSLMGMFGHHFDTADQAAGGVPASPGPVFSDPFRQGIPPIEDPFAEPNALPGYENLRPSESFGPESFDEEDELEADRLETLPFDTQQLLQRVSGANAVLPQKSMERPMPPSPSLPVYEPGPSRSPAGGAIPARKGVVDEILDDPEDLEDLNLETLTPGEPQGPGPAPDSGDADLAEFESVISQVQIREKATWARWEQTPERPAAQEPDKKPKKDVFLLVPDKPTASGEP